MTPDCFDLDLRARAKAIAAEANECCNSEDWFEAHITSIALHHLEQAVEAERTRHVWD